LKKSVSGEGGGTVPFVVMFVTCPLFLRNYPFINVMERYMLFYSCELIVVAFAFGGPVRLYT